MLISRNSREPLIRPLLCESIDMVTILSRKNLENYVRRVIELEHGKVGLNSDAKETPPLSRYGQIIKESESRDYARRIANNAENIIGLCRLELDTKRGPWDPSEDSGDVNQDTQDFFNQLLLSIQNMRPPYANIAFRTLAFVVVCDQNELPRPTPEHLVSALLQCCKDGQPCGFDETDCTLEKILFASRGLIMVYQPEEEVLLVPYCRSLGQFIGRGLSSQVNVQVEDFEKYIKQN